MDELTDDEKYEIWKDNRAKVDFVMNCITVISIICIAVATFGLLLFNL